jgi:VIT1/CCC1 family predicted Fe2+/Mn2+ transporter
MRRLTKTDFKETTVGTLKGLAAVATCFVLFLFTPFMTWFGYSRPSFATALSVTLEMVVVMTPVFLLTGLANRWFEKERS